jgi:Tol biopolymer transport system component
MSADGTGSQTLSPSIEIRGAAAQGAADWSPDGRWIVTGGADAQGPALFKIPVDRGTPLRLVEGDAVNPVWSPDGKLIVYAGPLSAGQVTLSAVRPDGTRAEFPALRVRQGGYRFSPTGAELIYLPTITSLDFWALDLRTNQRRQLTRLAARGKLHTFDVTPDGKAIVFDRARENSDIVLIELPK